MQTLSLSQEKKGFFNYKCARNTPLITLKDSNASCNWKTVTLWAPFTFEGHKKDFQMKCLAARNLRGETCSNLDACYLAISNVMV